MRNKIDFQLHPDVLFLNPWRDPGFQLLLEPEFVWRPIPKANITGFAASSDPGTNTKLTRLIRSIEKDHAFSKAIEYNTVPVVLDKVSFRKSYVQARDRWLLSGAVGIRLINRYQWINKEAEIDADAKLEEYFRTCREANEGKEIPVYSGMLEPDIDFAIPCRNTFNFFHFLSEALCQLTLLDGLDFRGNVYFHFPNPEDRQRAFIRKFVDALFPELEGRVFFERAPKDYHRVLTAYDLIGGHAQAPAAETQGINRLAPKEIADRGGITAMASRRPLTANAVNSTLFALRQRALKAIEGKDFSYLPKRFFVGRDDRGARVRHMEGEDLLVDHLRLFGFDYIAFENLEPLEQVAIMQNAEIMVSHHGAAFTNMLFANPQANVIEIGTLQTALHRWGDFWPMANVSGCNYVNFFADIKDEDPGELAERDTGGLHSVSISQDATGQIMAFIVALMGQYPKLETETAVERLAQQLLKTGNATHAIALLDQHGPLVETSLALCMLKADCHKALDEPKSELVALNMAHKVDQSHWHILVRIIWCARRCERPQVIRWALSRLEVDFPKRHQIFVGNHEWVRYVA